jgi:hypothetical protein
MPIFFRLNETGLSWAGEVEKLGFSIEDPRYIPSEYLETGNFLLFRMANGFGDWGILSAMPRLLKQKYPKCKVYLPSEELIKQSFPKEINNWDHWPNPERNVERVYKNNPYVDGFIDKVENEVFHDHYRIYNDRDINEPLINQVLKFWKFSGEELEDNQPEIYWTEEEISKGDSIIEKYFGKKEFCGLILSNTDIGSENYEGESEEKLQETLKKYSQYEFVYYGDKTPYEYIKVGLNLKEIDVSIRVQLYIRSKAKINLGYSSSMYDVLPRYVNITYIPVRQGMKSNTVKGIKYL